MDKKEQSVLIYHHLGLGDHIMCHGIVREYCKIYKHVGLFALPHNATSVHFMFRDIQNITIIEGNDQFARTYIEHNKTETEYNIIKIIGFEFLDRQSNVPLEKQFYQIAGIDLKKKWESFYIERDKQTEEKLFNKLVLPQKKYIFLHEDPARNFKINRKRITSHLPIIEPDFKKTSNIFDYCTIIERAEEIHVIDSSFMFLIDCLPYTHDTQKLFIHRYARKNQYWKLPILKKKWHIFILRDYKLGIFEYIIWEIHTLKEFITTKLF